jgi:hypothetical protein
MFIRQRGNSFSMEVRWREGKRVRSKSKSIKRGFLGVDWKAR